MCEQQIVSPVTKNKFEVIIEMLRNEPALRNLVVERVTLAVFKTFFNQDNPPTCSTATFRRIKAEVESALLKVGEKHDSSTVTLTHTSKVPNDLKCFNCKQIGCLFTPAFCGGRYLPKE